MSLIKAIKAVLCKLINYMIKTNHFLLSLLININDVKYIISSTLGVALTRIFLLNLDFFLLL